MLEKFQFTLKKRLCFMTSQNKLEHYKGLGPHLVFDGCVFIFYFHFLFSNLILIFLFSTKIFFLFGINFQLVFPNFFFFFLTIPTNTNADEVPPTRKSLPSYKLAQVRVPKNKHHTTMDPPSNFNSLTPFTPQTHHQICLRSNNHQTSIF